MNRAILAVVGFSIGVASLASTSVGQVRVDYYNGSDWINIAQFAATPPPNIVIDDAGLSLRYRVYAVTPATQSIGTIHLATTSGATPTLFVGQGLTDPLESQALPTSGAYNVGAITYAAGQPKLQIRVNATASDIAFWHIVRLDAGIVAGDVTHDPVGAASPPRLGNITAGEIGSSTQTKQIAAKRGNINRIEASTYLYSSVVCSEGSITDTIAACFIKSKSITALNGSINDIDANDYIGTGTGGSLPVTIQAKNGIHLVEAGGPGAASFIRAEITANANGGNGDLTSLQCITEAAPGGGHFYGSLTANRALGEVGRYTIFLEGNLNASITLAGDFANVISVGEAFTAGNTISKDGPGPTMALGPSCAGITRNQSPARAHPPLHRRPGDQG